MTQSAFGITPFSTRVDLWLDCEHGRVPLAQAASTFIMPASPQSLPPCKGEVVVSIDGKEFRRPVRLVNGMTQSARDALILADDDLPF